MDRRRRIGLTLAVVFLLAGRPASAVTAVTQVIDGVPQVIAPQQLIVACNPAVLPALCSDALAGVGAVVSAVGQDVFNVLTLPETIPLQGALDTLRASTAILSAEPNRIFTGSTLYPVTWSLPAMGAPGDSTLMPAGASPLVAVIDTGVAYEDFLFGAYAQAPALSATPFAAGWDFVNSGPSPHDDNGHGTAMATIIAGRGSFSTDAIPFVGAAAGATILPVKVLDATNRGTEFWLAEGIRYAVAAGAQVANLSLDFARNYVPGAALRDALAKARAAGMVIVAASGNTGSRVLYPAAFPDVISVGAIRLDNNAHGYAVASYSNTGEALDLVAPGGMAGQDVNHDDLWDGVLTQSFLPGSPAEVGWWLFAGTSPAAAHVSAAAAILIGNGVPPAAVRPLLLASAATVDNPGWHATSGAGRVQADDAVALAGSYQAPAPLYADAVAALRMDGRAAGAVMIANASGIGVPNVQVLARWRGAASASAVATTDGSGIARFVSPWPTSSRKLFVLQVPRVIYQGATQRPRAFVRSSGGGSLVLTVDVSGLLAGTTTATDGLGLWGEGFGQGLGSGTTGSGLGSGTTGSGLGSGTTGSTGGDSPGSYPLSTGIGGCPPGIRVSSYGPLSLSASQAFFSWALLASGYGVRTIDSTMVMTPGAAALDATELGYICGISIMTSASLTSGYFSSGTLFTAGNGAPPFAIGAGDDARFWAEVMNAEGTNAP